VSNTNTLPEKIQGLVWCSPGSAARCRAATHRGWNEGINCLQKLNSLRQ